MIPGVTSQRGGFEPIAMNGQEVYKFAVREVPTMSMDPISQLLAFITVRITMEAFLQEISLFRLCIRTKRQPLELRIN